MRERLERERQELTHRLEQEALNNQQERESALAETIHQRRVFWCVFIVVISAGALALWAGLFDASMSPETQAWARTVASAIIAGIEG